MDPAPSHLLQLAYNKPFTRQAPSSVSIAHEFMNREFPRTNTALPAVSSPLLLDFSSRYFVASPADRAEKHFDFLAGYAKTISLADLQRAGQPRCWQICRDDFLCYTPTSKFCRLVLRYGPGFHEARDSTKCEYGVGLLFQFELGKRKPPTSDAFAR